MLARGAAGRYAGAGESGAARGLDHSDFPGSEFGASAVRTCRPRRRLPRPHPACRRPAAMPRRRRLRCAWHAGEPKKIHTVAIEPDQIGRPPVPPWPATAANAGRAAVAPAAAPAPRPVTARASPAGIVGQRAAFDRAGEPGLRGACAGTGRVPAPPWRSRRRSRHAAGSERGARGGGGYAVQVTSQRSEAEAQTVVPGAAGQISGPARRPSADASAAPILAPRASITARWSAPLPRWNRPPDCARSLKAAGGNCIVQRN